MSNLAVIGGTHTFQVLFLDANQQPMVVVDPTITIFNYSTAGAKVVLVASTPMTAVPGDTGRYRYTYAVPSAFSPGAIFYGQMSAPDPNNPDSYLVVEEAVNALSPPPSGGLYARFVP